MKTIEEIISQYEPNREYPSYYHESKIIEMIKEAHRQACKEQKQITAFNFDDDRILNDTEPELK